MSHQDLWESQLTSASEVFFQPSSNFIIPNTTLATETAEALVILASATQEDRDDVSNLATTNSTLTQQMQMLVKKLTLSTLEIKTLKLKVAQNICTSSEPPASATTHKRFCNLNYCWSHGFDVGNDHTSSTCHNKKQGHVDTATCDNNQGGKV